MRSRADRRYRVDLGEGAATEPRALQRRAAGRGRLAQDPGQRARPGWCHRERDRAGAIDTDRFRQVYPDGLSAADLETIALRRIGSPSEISTVACFLASDAAAYVTGAVIPVDGGFTRALL